jgi:PPOX class probable F420-dependent enzyme
MLPEDVRALIDAPNLAHVATILPDGGPHTVPVWIGTDGPHVVFLTGPGSRKARNLAGDARVAFSLVDAERPFVMAHLRGHVVERVEGDAAWAIIDRLAQQYLGSAYPRGEDRVVFRVAVDHARAQAFA